MIKDYVSIIIPVFNRGKELREAIMSVLLQSYQQIEIIIVNDGSTDNTYDVAKELELKWPKTISVFYQINSGPGPARELGTLKSKGEFIQYLDSDDLLLPDKFRLQVGALNENPECGISYGISYQEDYNYNPPLLTGTLRSTGDEIEYLFPKLLNDRWWTTSSPLYRRSTIAKLGAWKDLINEEDWEFDARAGKEQTLLAWVPRGVSIRRINLSKNHLSYGGCTDINKVSARVAAKNLLFVHAIESGMTLGNSEMKIFSRECFLLCRQCAVLGLEEDSKLMFRLSRDASDRLRRNGLDYLIYLFLAFLLGWRRVGQIASKIRNML